MEWGRGRGNAALQFCLSLLQGDNLGLCGCNLSVNCLHPQQELFLGQWEGPRGRGGGRGRRGGFVRRVRRLRWLLLLVHHQDTFIFFLVTVNVFQIGTQPQPLRVRKGGNITLGEGERIYQENAQTVVHLVTFGVTQKLHQIVTM